MIINKFLIAVLILFTIPIAAQNSQVNWGTFSNGFEVSNSTDLITISITGQSFSGISTNSNSQIISGFLGASDYIITDIQDKQRIIPTVYNLYQNYPNPFNPSTTIKYSIPQLSFVTLKIYDILGREVTSLVNEEQAVGVYKIQFNSNKLSSGVYFYRITANSFVDTKKFIILK